VTSRLDFSGQVNEILQRASMDKVIQFRPEYSTKPMMG